ncbi:MAG: PDZ domain-containing protein, partial [Gemmatimonadetes bacterium]|nr:PDZ domain-containing protein [Gemmatimonadota bacterium]
PDAAGLSHNSVYALHRDRERFLWVGTADGLNRYDGYEFRVYRHDPASATTDVYLDHGDVFVEAGGRSITLHPRTAVRVQGDQLQAPRAFGPSEWDVLAARTQGGLEASAALTNARQAQSAGGPGPSSSAGNTSAARSYAEHRIRGYGDLYLSVPSDASVVNRREGSVTTGYSVEARWADGFLLALERNAAGQTLEEHFRDIRLSSLTPSQDGEIARSVGRTTCLWDRLRPAQPGGLSFRALCDAPSGDRVHLIMHTMPEMTHSMADRLWLDVLGSVRVEQGGVVVYVSDVASGSVADLAGFRVGDIVESLNGRPLQASGDLVDLVLSSSPGAPLTAEVRRGDERLSIRLTLPDDPRIGIVLGERGATP